ncbi:hypothetical protein B0J12DRAFT_713571 [Macrophomina phaseolina]|uniref:Dipeptidase n=1 Tax=Macrophomina phaseolina TaxID=35725 RepID=A0ABQ8FY06_9PEZI|nr:hypothetical protein B0J12DRAFT_713571 [Macrophomina phaseolina]
MAAEAKATKTYASAIYFDDLNIANFSREIFEAWRAGGVTGVSCTCSIANVMQWKKWFEEHSDLIIQAHTVAGICGYKGEGKTAVMLSWQNTAGIEDPAGPPALRRSSGAEYTGLDGSVLTGFGRQVVDETAKLGVVVSLSHCEPKTSEDTIRYATEPPCFSHKGEGLLDFPNLGGTCRKATTALSTTMWQRWTMRLGLLKRVWWGVGSDSPEGHARPSESMAWCNKDKGYARRLAPWGSQRVVKPLGPLGGRPKLAEAMARAGWSEATIRKVLGENWLDYVARMPGALRANGRQEPRRHGTTAMQSDSEVKRGGRRANGRE